MNKLKDVTVGSFVRRNIAGMIMELKVTQITKDRIICGPWEFDRETGCEIDEYLGWNNEITGSYLEE